MGIEGDSHRYILEHFDQVTRFDLATYAMLLAAGCAEYCIESGGKPMGLPLPGRGRGLVEQDVPTGTLRGTPTVTATAEVNGQRVVDHNQTVRPSEQADPMTPTLIADIVSTREIQRGKEYPNGNMATAHAEIGAIQQACDRSLTQGASMTMTVEGRAVCGYCLGDLGPMADRAGLNSLTIKEVQTGRTLTWTRNSDGAMGRVTVDE